jgi:hypothetical protein
VEKYSGAREATYIIMQRMRFVCWITKATDTLEIALFLSVSRFMRVSVDRELEVENSHALGVEYTFMLCSDAFVNVMKSVHLLRDVSETRPEQRLGRQRRMTAVVRLSFVMCLVDPASGTLPSGGPLQTNCDFNLCSLF